MSIAEEFLAAYDHQLRTDAETQGAIRVTHLGPLLLVTFAGGQGFVTYPHLDGADAQPVAPLVTRALDPFRDDPGSPGSSGRPAVTIMPPGSTRG